MGRILGCGIKTKVISRYRCTRIKFSLSHNTNFHLVMSFSIILFTIVKYLIFNYKFKLGKVTGHHKEKDLT